MDLSYKCHATSFLFEMRAVLRKKSWERVSRLTIHSRRWKAVERDAKESMRAQIDVPRQNASGCLLITFGRGRNSTRGGTQLYKWLGGAKETEELDPFPGLLPPKNKKTVKKRPPKEKKLTVTKFLTQESSTQIANWKIKTSFATSCYYYSWVPCSSPPGYAALQIPVQEFIKQISIFGTLGKTKIKVHWA